MKLSIIIPQYKESEEQVFTLFNLLNMQENVSFADFEVIIVNDYSSYQIPKEFFKQFKNLNIRSLRNPKNGGPGVARQYGIDRAKGDWLFFIDADDTIFSLLTIAKIFNIIEKNNCDIIRGKFLEEIVNDDTDEFSYVVKDDITWVHGKVYRKAILDKYDVRFPIGVRVNEDSYFNGVIFNLGLEELKVDDIFTIWRANPNSLTREKNKILYLTGYPNFIKAKDLMLDKLKEFVSRETFEYMVIQSLCFFYFNSQDKIWFKYYGRPEMDVIDRDILNFYNKYKEILLSADTETFDRVYQQTRVDHFSSASIRERETFEDYFWRLKNKFA